MLLRNGARVVATSRFPRDAAARYAREPDFESFKSRLQIFGLDLRHAPSVELLTRYLLSTLDRLDFLINNAAQTVRRPPGFYSHLIAAEIAPTLGGLPPDARALLGAHESLSASLSSKALSSGSVLEDAESVLGAWGGDSAGAGVWASARLSQLPYAEEEPLGEEMFPIQRVDSDLQQVDRRAMNSWRLKAADVPTPELLEVHLVNAIAPFLLNARLKPLMARDRTGDKHIVNVSAMEGIFTRGPKTDRHPHTNMAKAALNMFTRTSAADYLKSGIHMNSVDTGWVTDEDPLPLAERKERELDFQPPLDAIDGAARIVDPIFSGLNTREHLWGKFLKDYRPAPW
jgi:NAD(P)-dependent dehydrogenase (short-subunit alcohol dehydrogenase family)